MVNFHSKCKILGGVTEFFGKAYLCRLSPCSEHGVSTDRQIVPECLQTSESTIQDDVHYSRSEQSHLKTMAIMVLEDVFARIPENPAGSMTDPKAVNSDKTYGIQIHG